MLVQISAFDRSDIIVMFVKAYEDYDEFLFLHHIYFMPSEFPYVYLSIA
jgi:hypothetical protein